MSKYNLDDLCAFAANKGGECLSSEYKRVNTTYRFKCDKGHEFSEKWSEMRAKTDRDWCHECAMQRLKDINDARTIRMNAIQHTAFDAFKEAFDLQKIADACVSTDDEEPVVIPDDDYEKMFEFMVDYGPLLNRYSSYPLPPVVLAPITETDPHKEAKKRFFCLMATPWIATAWRAFDQPISFAEYSQKDKSHSEL